ncbi:MAG: chemotaxis protein [Gammaproteobacteria bacterium]|nr:MAG: chemotaxis protein [Gammaproteobacteria bacterium]
MAEKTPTKERAGIGFPFFLLIITIALMAGVFTYVNIQSRHDQQYISLAGEQQILSQRIAKYAVEASTGNGEALDQLKGSRDRFRYTLDTLERGNPEEGLPPSPPQVSQALKGVSNLWQSIDRDIQRILSRSDVLLALPDFVQTIHQTSPALSKRSTEFVRLLIQKDADARQVALAARQLALVERITRNLDKVFQGRAEAVAVIERVGRDTASFGRTLDIFKQGDPQRGIAPATDPEALQKLEAIEASFNQFSEAIGQVLDRSGELLDAQAAAREILGLSDGLFTAAQRLEAAYKDLAGSHPISLELGYALGGLSLLLLLLVGYRLVKDARIRALAAVEQNRRNQDAILRLLDEISGLAEGDLTRRATVTEAFTGAIADAFNYAIDSLKRLVSTINRSAEQVTATAHQAQTTALHLADLSNQQAEQITDASAAVNEMAVSIQQVTDNTVRADEVARASVDHAKRGGDAVRNTIRAMDTIRDQIQETAKRIKRLGESSQEIGDIVEIIDDIADQTNILALNAAIQAAMAGEAGRGFTVVADEVQRLAERVSNATKQIEVLVRTIQADTNEAVMAMEQSTGRVVEGTRLARNAGDALEGIERVSNELASLINDIASASRQQSATAASISESMNSVQELATETSAGSNEMASSIGRLVELAEELRKSVAGFKLPADDRG